MCNEYPIEDTLEGIVEIIQGHQITDEEIYNSEGNYPIYTGSNILKGYWNRTIVTEDMLPCLSYATKAFDGTVTLQNKLFDANNTAVLCLKEKYKETVNIEWLRTVLPNKFFNAMTSRGGVSYLNKDIVKDIKIVIPDFGTQLKQVNLNNYLIRSLNIISQVSEKYQALLAKEVQFEYNKYQAKDIQICLCIDYIAGSSKLTESAVYQRQNNSGKEYIVLTGGINVENTPIVILMDKEDIPRFEEREGLLVTRKGKAGSTRYLPPGHYTLNDDAYILFVKDSCKFEIDLKWLAIQYRSTFLAYASSSDNGTWNMSGFFKYTSIDIPIINEQQRIIKQHEIVQHRIKQLAKLRHRYLVLSKKEIFDGTA